MVKKMQNQACLRGYPRSKLWAMFAKAIFTHTREEGNPS